MTKIKEARYTITLMNKTTLLTWQFEKFRTMPKHLFDFVRTENE